MSWLALAGYALKLLGLVEWATKLFERIEARQEGRVAQTVQDQAKVIADAENANRARADAERGADHDLLRDDGFRRD